MFQRNGEALGSVNIAKLPAKQRRKVEKEIREANAMDEADSPAKDEVKHAPSAHASSASKSTGGQAK